MYFTNVTESDEHILEKKLRHNINSYITPCKTINSKYIIDLNIKSKT